MFASNRALLLVVLLAAVAAGKEKKEKQEDPLKATVREISAAIGKGDTAAAKAAFTRAETLKANYDDKKFAPVVKAIARGVNHKDQQIAMAAVETLGVLKVAGSSKSLGKLLSPPAKMKEDKQALCLAAIAAAGSIHDTDSLKTLEKNLTHKNAEVGVASAKALGGYKYLDAKPKASLVKRLIKALGSLEKSSKAARTDEAREASDKVRATLNETLANLTGKQGVSTAKDWDAWFKEESKKG